MLISLSRLHICGAFSTIKSSTRLVARRHRLFSTTARFASTRINGVYDVPVGSNGYFSLSVIHPTIAPSTAGNVIIRLPSGLPFQKLSSDENISSPEIESDDSKSQDAVETAAARSLADTTSSTVVTINYRLGERPYSEDQIPLHLRLAETEERPQKLNYRFPTPVHDTLTGFDWVLQNLQPTRVGVIGRHIGGSLALMLALTEPRFVHAVAAVDPVCDWTSLDEFCTSPNSSHSRRKRHEVPKDLAPLLQARERIFETATRYFDTFASPILFLRSAGKEVPKDFPKYITGPDHPVPLLVSKESPDAEELWDAYIPDAAENGELGFSEYERLDRNSDAEDSSPVRRRKALSRWPPYGLDYGSSGPRGRYSRQPVQRLEVELPWVRVFTSQNGNKGTVPPATETLEAKQPARRRRNQPKTVLAHQATEMVDIMRRACFFGRERGYAESRVTLAYSPSGEPGTENDSFDHSMSVETLEREVDSAGEWLVQTLNSEPKAESESRPDGDAGPSPPSV
ncbi:hypothetical protein BJX70DRAFT_401187 [Aspergillus crustosus]